MKYLDTVMLYKYRECSINSRARIVSMKPDSLGRWRIANLNQPFQGTISGWFYPNEFKVIE